MTFSIRHFLVGISQPFPSPHVPDTSALSAIGQARKKRNIRRGTRSRTLGPRGPRRVMSCPPQDAKDALAFDDGVLRQNFSDLLDGTPEIADEDRIKETRSLSLPSIYFQGAEDGVNPPELSENLHEKFSGPFDRILLQNVGHFSQREDPETVARELAIFLQT